MEGAIFDEEKFVSNEWYLNSFFVCLYIGTYVSMYYLLDEL